MIPISEVFGGAPLGPLRIYCGTKAVPPGKILGRPNQCYKSGLRSGFVAGIMKGEESGLQSGYKAGIYRGERNTRRNVPAPAPPAAAAAPAPAPAPPAAAPAPAVDPHAVVRHLINKRRPNLAERKTILKHIKKFFRLTHDDIPARFMNGPASTAPNIDPYYNRYIGLVR